MQARLTTNYRKYSSSDSFWIAGILIVACLVVLPIPLMGIPDNYDLMQHLRFAKTFYESVLTGNIAPGWAANDNAGLGSVGVRFYPPMAYLTMALTQLVTQSWFDTLWTNILLWMFIGCVGVYFWCKEWLPRPQAAGAAFLYAVVPYHVLQIYQSFLFAEFAAATILPFCFLFATRIVNRDRVIDVVLFSISLSALVLTHIPSTIIGTICLGIYTLLLIDYKRFTRIATRFVFAFAACLLSTSYYWTRFLAELSWVKHNTPQFYGSGYYDYTRYFFPMFFGSRDLYIRLNLWTFDLVTVLSLLLFIPLCAVIALNFKSTRVEGKGQRYLYALTATGAVALFMLSSASSFVWQNVSFIQKLQFPFRWLSVLSLAGTAAFAVGISEILKRGYGRKVAYPALILIVAVLLYDLSQQIIPSGPVSRNEFSARLSTIDSDEACECWWPVWGTRNALSDLRRASAGSRRVNITEWSRYVREFRVDAGEETRARVATFYYPNWLAEVNGSAVEVERNDDGTVSIPISTTASDVKVVFEEPQLLRAAKLISLLSAIALFSALATCIATGWRSRYQEKIP